MSNIKKQLLLLMLLLSTAINAFAVEVEIRGLWYDVITKGKAATVIQYKNDNYYSGSIVIPETVEYNGVTCSVTSIGNSAFSSCAGLTSVTIGSGIKNIGIMAFAECKELTDVYCYAKSVPSTKSDAFADSYIEYVTLHVPTTSIDAYKSAAPWSGFKTFMGLDGTLPDNPAEETKKCATPTISLVDSKLKFSCETEGVEYVSEVTFVDGKKYYDNEVSLTGVYKVSVYATKSGYDNSDVATAKFTMSSGSGIKGDVNGDGKVDVSDVVGTANIILQKQ